ncbi:MAG TPA: fumarylacetoacetate hydrolase family protein [Planctomycetota bacterium]|nr:fumarylacetoacetate hydrolase family protein [Planctomycetota bacterium]
MVLEQEGRHFDLSQGFEHARHGDVLDLVDRGVFEPRSGVEEGSAQRAPVAAPVETLTPIDPRLVGKILALTGTPRELFERRAAGDSCRWFSNRSPATLAANGTPLAIEGLAESDPTLDLQPAVVRHDCFLAVVISRRASGVAVEDAPNFVAGYTLASDFTRRTLDGRPRTAWFCESPVGMLTLGPAFVPSRSLDLAEARVTAQRTRGERSEPEVARCFDLASDVALAVAALSRLAILHPGDLVLVPTGVGLGVVEGGDVVRCELEGIGELVTSVRRRALLRQQA